jgi:hypothetical protein
MIPTTSSNPFSPLFGSGNKGLAPSLNAPCPGINMLHCRRGLQHITCVIDAAKSRGASGFALVTTQSRFPGLFFRLLIVTRSTGSSSCKCTNSAIKCMRITHAPARKQLALDTGRQRVGSLRAQEEKDEHLQRACSKEFSGDAIKN